MKKAIGFILVFPMLWISLSVLLLKLSWWHNKNKEKWRNLGLTIDDAENAFWDKHLGAFMIFSGSLIALFIGTYLLSS